MKRGPRPQYASWSGLQSQAAAEIPGFIELYSTYGAQGLHVLGFAVDDPIPALKAYANVRLQPRRLHDRAGHRGCKPRFGGLLPDRNTRNIRSSWLP